MPGLKGEAWLQGNAKGLRCSALPLDPFLTAGRPPGLCTCIPPLPLIHHIPRFCVFPTPWHCVCTDLYVTEHPTSTRAMHV